MNRLVFTLLIGVSSYAAIVATADAFELPSPAQVQRALNTVPSFSELGTFAAKTCRFNDSTTSTCDCVSFSNGNAQQLSSSLTATQIRTTIDDWTFYIGKTSQTPRSNPDQMIATTVWAQKDEQTIRIGNITRVGDQLTLSAVEWGANPAFNPTKCGGSMISAHDPTATATRVVVVEKNWMIDDFAEGFFGVGNINTKGGSRFGILPPTLYADPSVIGVRADVAYGRVGVYADVAPLNWYGGGLSVFTGTDETPAQLSIGALYDPTFDEYAVDASGDLKLGKPLTNITAHLEHPSSFRRHSPRRNLPNYHRDFRRSALAANLSDNGHQLIVGTELYTDKAFENDASIFARFATSKTIGVVDLDVQANHRTTQTDDATEHSASVGLRFAHTFGRGLFFTPQATILSNFAIAPFESGYDASTTGQLFAGANAGVRYRGKFDRAIHTGKIQISAQQELAGFQSRGLRDGISPFSYPRIQNFGFVSVGLENTVRSGGWNFELPLRSVWLTDNGMLKPLGGVLVNHEPVSLDLRITCSDKCSDQTLRGTGSVVVGPATFGYGVSDASADDFSIWDTTSLFAIPRLSRSQLTPDSTADQFHQFATVKVTHENWSAYTIVERSEFWLMYANGSWKSKSLGWGIGLRAGVNLTSEDYFGSIGLVL